MVKVIKDHFLWSPRERVNLRRLHAGYECCDYGDFTS